MIAEIIQETQISKVKLPTDIAILLSHSWYQQPQCRIYTQAEEFYYCKLSTFLDHCIEAAQNDWQYLFTCSGVERGTNREVKTKFCLNYHYCSYEYLEDILTEYLDNVKHEDHEPERTVSFILRVNQPARFYSCLVKLNSLDWAPESSRYRKFPVRSSSNV